MKTILKGLLVVGSLLVLSSPSHAWVSVGLRFHHVRIGINPFWGFCPGPVYWQEPIYVQPAPVIVQQPYIQQPIVQQPVVQQPVTTQSYSPPSSLMIPDPEALQTSDSQKYRDLLADFHSRLAREKSVLERQITKGGLNRGQYNRDKKILDEMTQDEQKWAQENKGALSVAQINNLDLRLRQAEQIIQQDLSE